MPKLPDRLRRLARKVYITTDNPPWYWQPQNEPHPDAEHVAKTTPRIVSCRDSGVQKRLVSSRELADIIGVTRATITRLHDAGNIPAPICIGRIRRWRQDEIDRWIQASCPGRQRWIEMEEHRLHNRSR